MSATHDSCHVTSCFQSLWSKTASYKVKMRSKKFSKILLTFLFQIKKSYTAILYMYCEFFHLLFLAKHSFCIFQNTWVNHIRFCCSFPHVEDLLWRKVFLMLPEGILTYLLLQHCQETFFLLQHCQKTILENIQYSTINSRSK